MSAHQDADAPAGGGAADAPTSDVPLPDATGTRPPTSSASGSGPLVDPSTDAVATPTARPSVLTPLAGLDLPGVDLVTGPACGPEGC